MRLLANSLRFQHAKKWHDVTKAVGGVGFSSSFIEMIDDELEKEEQYHLAVCMLLSWPVDV